MSKATTQCSFKETKHLYQRRKNEIEKKNLEANENKHVLHGKIERGGALMEACEGAESEWNENTKSPKKY